VAAGIVAITLAALLPSDAGTVTIRVRTHRQFEAAVVAMRSTGGTIVLLPHVYRQPLVVGPRSARPLRIVGSPGVKVERFLLENTRAVSLGGLTIAPVARDAWLDVSGSERITLHDLVVTAYGTRFSSTVQIPDSSRVTIQRSRFTHCGDQSPTWSNCLWVHWPASHILVERSWFHDCLGCDFIHGRFRADLTIRDNRLERALPCKLNETQERRARLYLPKRATERCGHQDLIELFGGNGLRIESNHFGVYRDGGAQVYLTGAIDHATVSNNVFVGTDPRLPLYHSRVGLLIGGRGVPHVPLHVKVLGNTILTGATRADGYTGSIALSPVYRHIRRLRRPVIADNVIGVLQTPQRVCRGAREFQANVVVEGHGCAPAADSRLTGFAGGEAPGSNLPIDFRIILGTPAVGVSPPG
jgi:hypothetical protein